MLFTLCHFSGGYDLAIKSISICKKNHALVIEIQFENQDISSFLKNQKTPANFSFENGEEKNTLIMTGDLKTGLSFLQQTELITNKLYNEINASKKATELLKDSSSSFLKGKIKEELMTQIEKSSFSM